MFNLLPDYPVIFSFLTGFLVSLLMIPPIVKVSRAKKLGAVPNGRTSHSGQVPALGGVAIFGAICLGTLIWMRNDAFGEFKFLFAALIIIFFIGLKDDLVNLGWLKKIISEGVAALLVIVFADVRIATFHGLLGIGELPYWFSLIFSVFIFIALINSSSEVQPWGSCARRDAAWRRSTSLALR